MTSTYTPDEPTSSIDHDAPPVPRLDAFVRDAWSGTDVDEARSQLEAALRGRQFTPNASTAAVRSSVVFIRPSSIVVDIDVELTPPKPRRRYP